MGVTLAALGVLAALAVAALVTRLLESRLGGGSPEKGAAGALRYTVDMTPGQGDRWMYGAAPLAALLGVAWAAVVVPLGPDWIGADLGIAAFYALVAIDFVVLGLALGGWGAATAEAVDVFYRVTAQLVAYVVPMGLAYVGAIMMAGSLSTMDIVNAQARLWYVVAQPLGFTLYVVSGLMQAYRPPFIEPFARSAGGGVLSVFGGWKAITWRLALDGLLFVVAVMGAVLYLGGWQGPVLSGPVWMLAKTYGLMALMLWLGRRVRPLDTRQMLRLSWLVLTPLGLLNVLVVGALILLGVGRP